MYVLTLTLTSNLGFILRSGSHMAEVIDCFTGHFNEMRDWCIINLDVGTWSMGNLKTLNNEDRQELTFSHDFNFVNQEDVTAFCLVFDTIPKTYVRD